MCTQAFFIFTVLTFITKTWITCTQRFFDCLYIYTKCNSISSKWLAPKGFKDGHSLEVLSLLTWDWECIFLPVPREEEGEKAMWSSDGRPCCFIILLTVVSKVLKYWTEHECRWRRVPPPPPSPSPPPSPHPCRSWEFKVQRGACLNCLSWHLQTITFLKGERGS